MDNLNARSFGEALRRELSLVRETRSSNPTKYSRVKCLFKNRLDATAATCYLSNLAQQWTPRIGQALMGMPHALVILTAESLLSKRSREAGSYAERLKLLIEYVGQLECAAVFVGEERHWTCELVVGMRGAKISDVLEVSFPEAQHIKI
jgi:hypothetical protein